MTDAFKQAMSKAGIEPPGGIIADGTLHRFTVQGDRARSENGWYLLHIDDPAAGAFGCWKRGISETWSGKPCQTMNPAEKTAYTAKMEAAKRQREEERERVQANCRAWCADTWKKAKDATSKNVYLERKQVKAYGLKLMGDALMIPVCSLGRTIHGVQFIQPDGTKKFKTGTVKQGHFHLIGKPVDDMTIIAEGYATGASIHQATGHAVLVAFDAGNLKPVAESIHKQRPKLKIIIAGDNDQWTAGNPGATKAAEAAKAVGGAVVLPRFACMDTKPTDFNDLYQLDGPDAVREQISPPADDEAPPPPGDEHAPPQVTPNPATIEVGQCESWPEPLPLPDGLPPVKSLDSDMIPLPLRGWLMDISDRMQIPPDFSTAAAVVALGSIIGRACGIYPKRHDDWLVVPNLWGAVVGRPSLMKTPAVSEAQRHLVRLETEARDEYRKAADASEIDKEIVKITRAAIGEEIKKAVKQGKDIEEARGKLAALQTDEPIRRRYQTQDGTTEKIGELLNQNPRGLLVNRDELVGWFRSLDRDGREGDRAFYLEAWNGTRSFTYDRIGRGTLDISALCISIFGAITPGPLSSYVYQANRGGNGDDGLLQRFQVFVWPDAPTEWRNIDRLPDTTEKNRGWEIFKALSGDIPGAVMEGGSDIPALRFSPAGQDIFDQWRNTLETRLRSGHGLHPSMESHLTKYRKLMPSLALIFHLVAVADGTTPGPVSETAALMAAAWCDYLESHAGRIYGAATMPGMDAAREIVKHILRGVIQEGATVREIWRHQWSRLSSSEEVKAGLEVLSEYDWLSVVKATTRGRSSELVRLNPGIKLL